MLLVVAEIYRQQLWLYENKKQSIDDRIVFFYKRLSKVYRRRMAAKYALATFTPSKVQYFRPCGSHLMYTDA